MGTITHDSSFTLAKSFLFLFLWPILTFCCQCSLFFPNNKDQHKLTSVLHILHQKDTGLFKSVSQNMLETFINV